jgi:hypothetical protein
VDYQFSCAWKGNLLSVYIFPGYFFVTERDIEWYSDDTTGFLRRLKLFLRQQSVLFDSVIFEDRVLSRKSQ